MCVDCGLSPSIVSGIRSGRKKGINAESAEKIAKYFGVSLAYVVAGEEEETQILLDPFTQKIYDACDELTDADKEVVLAIVHNMVGKNREVDSLRGGDKV